MNLVKAFVEYMENAGFGTFGTNLFIGGVPQNAPSTCWWVVSAGGNAIIKNKTNEKVKNYIVSVFYRNTDSEVVYNLMQSLEEQINSDDCPELTDHDVVEFEATLFPTDQDLDVEDRTVGLLQVTLSIHA